MLLARTSVQLDHDDEIAYPTFSLWAAQRVRLAIPVDKYGMRLYEFVAPKLFLGTSTEQTIDATVSLDEPVCWLDAEIENALEARRPEGSLSREWSFILSLVPGGAEFTYAVEPIGKLERQHLGWIEKLQEADPSQTGVLAHYAIGYWSGRECPEARASAWEYRASKLKVLGV